MTLVRCAIYTRKSTDEGLDQAFNSLDAQREACEAYIASQRHEGWKALRHRYDDGGHSGGTLDRPALTRLFSEIDAGRIDMVVVYKIDRLTRSLSDFAKLVDRLDAAGASFVSVTQAFNTSTSMGRLTLNVLLSFAQFEREVTAERIRDKIAASKKKGIWMGGRVPLGYDKTDAGLVINEDEAETVRTLFRAYLALGCVRRLHAFADEQGFQTKTHKTQKGEGITGTAFSRGRLYHLLKSPIYIGRIPHKNETYEGLHDAILSEEIWEAVQAKLKANAVTRSARSNAAHRSLFAGKLFDGTNQPLTPSHANKSGRRYRYYNNAEWRLPAEEVEAVVLGAIADDAEIRIALQRSGRSALPQEEAVQAIQRIIIEEGILTIQLNLGLIGGPEHHSIKAPLSMRRRGVERKLVLDGAPARKPDLVLIRRVLRASNWVKRLKAGETISEIAKTENVSPEYITHNIDAAFLSAEILDEIAAGAQPPNVSAKALTRMRIPACWETQRTRILR